MNTSTVHILMKEAHACAMAMLDSGLYVQKELPNVRMEEALRASTLELCSQLIGTKHDIIHELSELDDLLRDGATNEAVAQKVALIIRWLWDDISQIHELVTKLEAAAHRDPACGSAYILVAESAVNILNPFNRAKTAADSVTDTSSA